MKTFEGLIEDQFNWAGATKYRSQDGVKEVTDELVEDFGWNGLLWTQAKYTKRFKNQGLEKDLLKIATYQFINWLKLGFHYTSVAGKRRHVSPSFINTTVEVKSKEFPSFLTCLASYEHNEWQASLGKHPMDQIYGNLKEIKEGNYVDETLLLENTLICKQVWHMAGFHLQEVHNTDTGRK